MKLSKKSWHAWVYQFSYGFDKRLPSNLCPYFWKFLLSLVVFPLGFLFQLPIILTEIIWNKVAKTEGFAFQEGIFAKSNSPIIKCIGAYAGVLIVFSMVFMWINHADHWLTFGIFGYVIVLIVLAAFIVTLLEERRYSRAYPSDKEKKPSIFVEFIKAKYNKYCPKIDWKN